jgi:hypothetical protein
MKKSLLFSLITLFAWAGFAQGNPLVLTNAPTGEIKVSKDSLEFKRSLYLANTGTDTIDVLVVRISTDYAPGQSAYICWDFCYGSVPSLTDGFVKVAPNDTLGSAYYLAFQPNGVVGTSTVTLRFVNAANPNQFVDQSFSFNTDPASSIDREVLSQQWLGAAFYGGSDKEAVFALAADRPAANERFEVTDLQGKMVFRGELPASADAIRVPYSALSSGTYMLRWYRDQALSGVRKFRAVQP